MAMTMKKFREQLSGEKPQKNKTAFLVLGPESSGTRVVTEILRSAGCDGDSGHGQRWDVMPPDGDKIVWRRSMPHAHNWPDLDAMHDKLDLLGYEVKIVVTTRDWKAMIKSQLGQHVPDERQGLANIQEAMRRIFEFIYRRNLDYIIMSYDAMVLNKHEYLKSLLSLFNLEYQEVEIRDENAKHY